MRESLRLAVLASGRGSNLQAVLDACRSGSILAEVAIVISNRPDCQAIERACRAGLATFALTVRQAGSRRVQMRAFADQARASGAQLVVLAGFDRIVTGCLLEHYAGHMINIHPSLLPAFPGGMAPAPQAAALAAGVKYSGCTVHLVTAQVDSGAILDQAVVPVLDGDDCARLGERILRAEHRLLPDVIDRLARGQLSLAEPAPDHAP